MLAETDPIIEDLNFEVCNFSEEYVNTIEYEFRGELVASTGDSFIAKMGTYATAQARAIYHSLNMYLEQNEKKFPRVEIGDCVDSLKKIPTRLVKRREELGKSKLVHLKAIIEPTLTLTKQIRVKAEQ